MHFHMKAIHSIPFLALFLNLYISRFVFISSHYKYVVVVGFCYSWANYFGTLYRKSPLYPFLTWEGVDSLFVCLLINMFMVVLFKMAYWSIKKWRGHLVSDQKLKVK